jgi:hypothetical protein
MRHDWEDLYLAAMEAGMAKSRDYKQVIQVLDRVTEKIRHADYGYAGFWDRKGNIRENELAHIFNFDDAFGGDLDELKAAVAKAKGDAEAQNWDGLSGEVKNIKSLLLAFEDKWTEREKQFRPLDI